jgi:hypothetical protein
MGHKNIMHTVRSWHSCKAANFAKLLGLVRGTVEAAGQRLFAFHFPEHTRPHLHILRMFTQFGPAAILYATTR